MPFCCRLWHNIICLKKKKRMQDKNENKGGEATTGYSGRGQGMQGIDKPPGEETSQGTDNTIRDAQKGKDKPEGDPPMEESGRPVDHQ